jgi:tetratricopeptide (TPR) repeat protein
MNIHNSKRASKMNFLMAMALVFFAGAILPARANAQTPPVSKEDDEADKAYSIADLAKRSEAFYDFTMGHLNEVFFVTTNRADYATAALDFYKKAYALDPDSPVIGEHLAEMYYEARRAPEAVKEVAEILQKDPSNLAARRLLVRIYLRTLSDPSTASTQMETAIRAIEQLEQIRKLDPKDTESELWLVRLYRMTGDTTKAENILQDLLKQDPNDEGVIEQAAQLMLDHGRAEEAINLLKGATAHAPSGRLSDLLGDAYTQVHDFANAEIAYNTAVGLEPEDPGHHRGLAQTFAAEGKFKEALVQYQLLADADPDDPENYLHLAEMHRQLHQLDEAEKDIVQAKQRAPGNLEVVYSEAMIYEAQGRYSDAIQTLNTAVASLKSETTAAPTNRRSLAVLYEQLGRLYIDSENYTDAIKILGDMAQLGEEEARRASVLMVEAYRAAGDLPHALEAAASAIAKYPDERELRVTRALLLGENGDPDQAASQLRALLTHSAADLDIDLDLAQVYQQNKRYDDAEAALAQAENLATHGNEHEMVWFMRGTIYDRQKKYDQAEAQFNRVLKANPDDSQVLNYFGYMLADRGVRLPEATEMIKRALAEDPNNGAYLDSLGWAYFKQDKLAEAEDSLRQAALREPGDATILDHLGDVYFKRGKLDLAAAQWDHALTAWHHTLPLDMEPDKISALEAKIANVKRQIAQQKTNGPAKPQKN